MKKIYIVDAVNFVFRSYYAIGPMTNARGESTNALYGFIRSIYKLIREFPTDYFIAVFDGPENKRSRTEIYSEYKSHRTGMPEDLFPQLERALTFCEIAGIPFLSIPGVEADDTMGSIAQWAEKKGADVFLCSSDKDLCQLVSDHIFVINAHKDNLLIDRTEVKKIFGVTPEQMIDFLAIMGDTSDNIPGLPGFGPKTAASLLEKYGSLDEIIAHAGEIPGKKGETILAEQEIALLSRRLATIQLDVDFPKEEFFFQLKVPDLEKVKAFYHEMRFLSLLREMGDGDNAPSRAKGVEQESGVVDYRCVDDAALLESLIEEWKGEKEICIDVESTDVRPMRGELVGLGIGICPKRAWYVPMNGNLGKKKALELLKPLLESPDIGFIGHNIKYDLHVLANEGIFVKRVAFDTILASYLIAPHTQRHNLDELSLEKCGKVKIPIEALIGKGKNQIGMDAVPIDKVTEYCCEDVDYTLRLKEVFEKQIDDLELRRLFYEIEVPLIFVLMQMEREGIFVDVAVLKKMSTELVHSLKHLEEEIFKLAGEEFNLNSPKQLSHILFDRLKIRAPKKTATGYSTAADVLESLQGEAPIIEKIIAYRTLEKLRSTYVDALPEEINPTTHRIHCTFNQSVAATGRLSCQNPNLQNIPVRTAEGKKIRAAFRPQKLDHHFLSADYSQIELRLLAHLSEDPVLIHAFEQNEDIHAYTASLVFDLPLSQVTPQMRYQAKAVNFGILYGQSAYGLSQNLKIEYEEAVSFIEAYFSRYKKVKEFLEFCKESVRKTGRAVTLTGRQRPIPEIHSKNPTLKGAAERLAINTPLQGTAADLIKLAMLQVDHYLREHPDQGKMILQIHDELLFEVPDQEVKSLSTQVKRIMEGVFTLKVPLIVDISIGKNWGEC